MGTDQKRTLSMTAVDEVHTKLVECDLSEAVEYLRRVRFAEYFLIFFAMALAAGFPTALIELVTGATTPGNFTESLIGLSINVPLFAAAVVAYLSSGHLRPGIWRVYVFILPIAALNALFAGFAEALGLSLVPTEALFLAYLTIAITTLVGFGALMRLRRVQLLPTNQRMLDLILLSQRIRRQAALARGRGRRINAPKGILLVALGLVITAAVGVVGWILGPFLVLKGRQNLQVSADSLLAIDRRQPFLFLRSQGR
jgi:hypothetical protein